MWANDWGSVISRHIRPVIRSQRAEAFGVNIAYISESLGHSDLKTTENYLASFEREERQKNAELLTRF